MCIKLNESSNGNNENVYGRRFTMKIISFIPSSYSAWIHFMSVIFIYKMTLTFCMRIFFFSSLINNIFIYILPQMSALRQSHHHHHVSIQEQQQQHLFCIFRLLFFRIKNNNRKTLNFHSEVDIMCICAYGLYDSMW